MMADLGLTVAEVNLCTFCVFSYCIYLSIGSIFGLICSFVEIQAGIQGEHSAV